MQVVVETLLMSTCHLIICEKMGRWAAALRLALEGQEPHIVETRSLAGCERALAKSPWSLMAIEATAANLEAVLDFVLRATARFPHLSVVVLLDSDASEAAALFCEAGAIGVVVSLLEAPRLARLARRQFAIAPQHEPGLAEFVASRMPWPAHATT
jgi:hypothetical protein